MNIFLTSSICCWTTGRFEKFFPVTLGALEKPSFLRISALIVFLVISLKAVLSEQAEHFDPGGVSLRSNFEAEANRRQQEAWKWITRSNDANTREKWGNDLTRKMKTVLKMDHIMITRRASVKISDGTVIKAILNELEDSFSYVQAAVRSKILWRCWSCSWALYERQREHGEGRPSRHQPAATDHLCWPMRADIVRWSTNESAGRAGAEVNSELFTPPTTQTAPPSALAPTEQGRVCQWSFDILFTNFSIISDFNCQTPSFISSVLF